MFGSAAIAAKSAPLKASIAVVSDVDLSKLAMARTYDYTIKTIDPTEMKDQLRMNLMGYYKTQEHMSKAIDEYIIPHNVKQKQVSLLHSGTGHRFTVTDNTESGNYLVHIHNDTHQEIIEDVAKKASEMSYIERKFVEKINEALR